MTNLFLTLCYSVAVAVGIMSLLALPIAITDAYKKGELDKPLRAIRNAPHRLREAIAYRLPRRGWGREPGGLRRAIRRLRERFERPGRYRGKWRDRLRPAWWPVKN